MGRELPQFRKVRVIQRLIAEGRIADYGIEKASVESGSLETIIYMMVIGIKILGDGGSCGIEFHRKKVRVKIFRAETDEIADARRGFQNAEFFAASQSNLGKSLIDTSDNSFRGIMSILSGTAGGGIGVRGKQALQFPVFSGPLRISCIKDLRQAAPAHIADEDFLLFRRGQCRAAGLELFEQAYGGDVIRIFGFRAANAQPVFRGYPVVFRLMSMPILSNISESDIPRKLACREVSLLSALFSMVAC